MAVSAAFRDAFCAGLVRLAEQGQLVGVSVAEVIATVATMQAKPWEVFAKPFEKPEAVIEYLSRYVHAVAISNSRLTHIGDGQVSFTYYDNQDGGKQKEMTLSAFEFIRRFLWHVLPDGFVRTLRGYYGLHHSAARKTKLPRARALLGLPPALPKVTKLVLAVWLADVVGVELHRCRFCGAVGTLSYRGEVAQMPWVWLWLKVLFGWLFAEHWRVLLPANVGTWKRRRLSVECRPQTFSTLSQHPFLFRDAFGQGVKSCSLMWARRRGSPGCGKSLP